MGVRALNDSGGDNHRYLIVGGAGFLGSHFADRLMGDAATVRVTVYDNFSSGKNWHIAHHIDDPRFEVIRADVNDLERLTAAAAGHGTVIHLAANPDIAAAATDPDIDFRDGTVLTRNVLEAMRLAGSTRILFASGSGVYGDLGDIEATEDRGGLHPISTYGASKLACEGLISAYVHMFDMTGRCFRFGNVIGPRQTHGVGYDFLRKLRDDPTRLAILGDGNQSKSYIHADDTVSAVLHAAAHETLPFQVYNVATGDYITVSEIAELCIECAGLDPADVSFEFAGGHRGWKGDVPVVRLDTSRIGALGWTCSHSSREAMRRALSALLEEMD